MTKETITPKDYDNLVTMAKKVASLPDGPMKKELSDALYQHAASVDTGITPLHPEAVLGNILGYTAGIGKTAAEEALLEGEKDFGFGGQGGRMQNIIDAANPFEGAPSGDSFLNRMNVPEGYHPFEGLKKYGINFNPSTREMAGFGLDASTLAGYNAATKDALLKYGESGGAGLVGKRIANTLINPAENTGQELIRSSLSDADKAVAARGAPTKMSDLVINQNIPGSTKFTLTQNINKVLNASREAIDQNMAGAKAAWEAKNPGVPLPAATINQVYGDVFDRLDKLKGEPTYTEAAQAVDTQLKSELRQSLNFRPDGQGVLGAMANANDAAGSPVLGPNGEQLYEPGGVPQVKSVNKVTQPGYKLISPTTGDKVVPPNIRQTWKVTDPGVPSTNPSYPTDPVDFMRMGENTPIGDMNQIRMPPEELRRMAIGRGKAAQALGKWDMNPNTQAFEPTGLNASAQADLQEAARRAEQSVLEQTDAGAGAAAKSQYDLQHSILSGRDYIGDKFGPQDNIKGFRVPQKVPASGWVRGAIDTANSAKLPIGQALRSPWTQLGAFPAINAATRQDPSQMSPEEMMQFYLGAQK